MARTILFVDQEKFVHKALKRSFRKMRDEWDMHFVASPLEALEVLNKHSMDVIVSETLFTGESGLDFLKVVRENHPQSVRIILSGYSDQDVIVKTVDIAHQYLAKPCEDDTLEATISKAIMMKNLLDNESLKEIVSQIDSLPTLPSNYVELVKELNSEDSSIENIGAIISKDMGLTAKILKMVNSSFFGLRQEISNPAKAVSFLGTDLIKTIVLTSGTFDKFKNLKYPGFSLEEMWAHAMRTGGFAKIIAQESRLGRQGADTAFMAGLLHDIGKLLIASHLPDSFGLINKLRDEKSISTADAELNVIGTTHASIGSYLLGLWGLPDAILEATAFHHTPDLNSTKNLNTTTIIHVANALAHAGDELRTPGTDIDHLDYEYLRNSSFINNLDDWRAECVNHMDDIPTM